MMAVRGFLRADQMAGAFTLLRSNDLIWSRVVRHYLLGERTPMNAIMAWNEDATRMPYRMHSQYLRELFLENRLSTGRYVVAGRAVSLSDIACPIFCVGTETDHVSPWRSVYKINILTDTDVTFALTAGGHNGGILSEPGHARRHFRIAKKTEGDIYADADAWLAATQLCQGSWWPAWTAWLSEHSEPDEPVRLQAADRAQMAAPGTYVFG
jgi:polyhydroxyalkanoate synthase